MAPSTPPRGTSLEPARALAARIAALRPRSLRARLLIVLLLAVAAALGTVAATAGSAMSVEFERYVARNRRDVQSIAEQLAPNVGGRVVLFDRDGRILGDSGLAAPPTQASDSPSSESLAAAPPERVRIIHAEPGEAPGGGGGDGNVSGGSAPGHAVAHTVAADAGAPAGGALSPEQLFARSLNRTLLLASAAGGLAALGLACAFAHRFLRPVDALTAAARRMEAGDLDQRVAVETGDEIGQLAHAFNAMADSLRRAERLRRHMVTDIAHELRTPLHSVRSHVEALEEGVLEPTPEVLAVLRSETHLLSRLVEDLQDLSLAEAGQLTLRRAPASAAHLVGAAVQAVAPRAAERALTVETDVPASLPALDVDPERVGQVLRNLLENAMTHSRPGAAVRVCARPAAAAGADGALVEVRVSDEGEGIPPEHVEYVFERFYRADASRTRGTGGAGIGLAIVKQLVEAHGGTVAIQSAPARGTTVTLTLPVHRGAVGALRPALAGGRWRSPRVGESA